MEFCKIETMILNTIHEMGPVTISLNQVAE